MSLNSTSENYFQESTNSTVLSEQQRNILERVLAIIEKNPELNKTLSESFRGKARNLLATRENFDLLISLIDENTQKALSKVENQYTKDGDKDIAMEESKKIIGNATLQKLAALKISNDFA